MCRMGPTVDSERVQVVVVVVMGFERGRLPPRGLAAMELEQEKPSPFKFPQLARQLKRRREQRNTSAFLD